MKVSNMRETILKLDLSKVYDHLDWNFLCLVLIDMVYSLQVVNYIMGSIQSYSLEVMINGVPSN